MKRIAVYGSLRAGYWNHDRYGLQKALRFEDGVVRGSMYKNSRGPIWYPFLFEEADSKPEHVREHVVEVYEIPEPLFERIALMETASGYKTGTVMVHGIECNIFWADYQGAKRDELFVERYDSDKG